MSRPAISMPITSSVGSSSIDSASTQLSWLMVGSDRIDDRVGDHLAVVDALALRELEALRRAHHGVEIAADVEHRAGLRQLGAEDRVVGLTLEARRLHPAQQRRADHVALVVRVVE